MWRKRIFNANIFIRIMLKYTVLKCLRYSVENVQVMVESTQLIEIQIKFKLKAITKISKK